MDQGWTELTNFSLLATLAIGSGKKVSRNMKFMIIRSMFTNVLGVLWFISFSIAPQPPL